QDPQRVSPAMLEEDEVVISADDPGLDSRDVRVHRLGVVNLLVLGVEEDLSVLPTIDVDTGEEVTDVVHLGDLKVSEPLVGVPQVGELLFAAAKVRVGDDAETYLLAHHDPEGGNCFGWRWGPD